VVVVDLVLAVGELDDGVVGADAVAVVAAEAVAAGHAAACLVQGRAGVEPAGHLVEGADPPGRLEPGPHGVRRVGVIPGVEAAERRQLMLGRGVVRACPQPRVDVAGCLLAVADGHGDGALGGHHVPAGEDARVAGHQVGTDLDHAIGERHPGHVLQHGQVGVLA